MAVFIYLYPKDRVRSILTKAATSSLKRHVTIKNLNYSFKGVILNEVVLYDGEDINSPVFLKVKHVGLSFSVISLIRSKLEIYKIYLQEPELHITFNKEKKSNVELLLNDLSSGKGESSLETKISKMVIEKATIHCKNLPKYLKPLEGTHKGTCYIRMKEKNKVEN